MLGGGGRFQELDFGQYDDGDGPRSNNASPFDSVPSYRSYHRFR